MKIIETIDGWYTSPGGIFVRRDEYIERFCLAATDKTEAYRLLRLLEKENDDAFAAFERSHPELNP